jgi:catechol 2,3-dioxygenase-like lactoylglutathione lyase family enzyme
MMPARKATGSRSTAKRSTSGRTAARKSAARKGVSGGAWSKKATSVRSKGSVTTRGRKETQSHGGNVGGGVTKSRSVGIYVSDPDRALEFYRDTLGFEVLQDVPMGEMGPPGHEDKRWIEVAPGIDGSLDMEPTEADAFPPDTVALPGSLEAAIGEARADRVLPELLGKGFWSYYCGTREWELAAWQHTVTDWERRRYEDIV